MPSDPESRRAKTYSQNVPWYIILSYCSVSWALEMTATQWSTFTTIYFTDTAMLSPGLAAILAFLYRMWSLFMDPIISNLTDGTKSKRWGRRRGWMLFGVFPYAVFFTLTWVIPVGSNNQTGLFAWIIAMQCLTDTCWAMVRFSNLAFINDLTTSFKIRYRINTFRTIALGLGSATAMCIAIFLDSIVHNAQEKFIIYSMCTTGSLIVCSCVCVWLTKRYSHSGEFSNRQVNPSIVRRFWAICQHSDVFFVVLLASTSAVILNTTVSQTPYLVIRYIKGDITTVSLLFLISLLSAGVFVVIVLVCLKQIEKKTLFYAGASCWCIFFVVLPFVDSQSTYLLYIDAVFFGAGLCGTMVAPPALLTDAAVVLEADTGYRSEASLYAGMHMLSKVQLAIAGALFQFGIWAETPISKTIDDQGIISIRILTVAIPMVLLAIAVFSNTRLSKRFSRDQIKVIQVDLDARKAVDNPIHDVQMATPPYVTYITINGVSADLFTRMSESGKLPNMTELSAKGLYAKSAVTSFPSTWGYGLYSLFTGKPASSSGIAGYNWFNRKSRFFNGQRSYGGLAEVYMNEDLVKQQKTIFEEFPKQYSNSINSLISRGSTTSTSFYWRWRLSAFNFLKLFGIKIPTTIYEHETMVIDTAIASLSSIPKIQAIGFNGMTQLNNSPDIAYERLLCHYDWLIGLYIEACKSKRLYDQMIFCITSSHGIVQAHNEIDLHEELQTRLKLRIFNGNQIHNLSRDQPDSFRRYVNYQAVLCINGSGFAHLYMRNPTSLKWNDSCDLSSLIVFTLRNRDPINLIKETLLINGVQFVCTVGINYGSVRIWSRDGFGEICSHDQGQTFTYIVENHDPLEHRQRLDEPFTANEYLNSCNPKFPYALIRIYQLMKSGSAGDLVIVSNNQTSFDSTYTVQGGLSDGQITVPFIVAGPSINEVSCENLTTEELGQYVINVMKVSKEQ